MPSSIKEAAREAARGWDGGADIITRQQSTWLSSITPFYTHVSGFYQSSCIPKCKFVLKIKSSFRRTKEFLNCWLWEGLYYPQPWVSGIAIDSPHPFLSPLGLLSLSLTHGSRCLLLHDLAPVGGLFDYYTAYYHVLCSSKIHVFPSELPWRTLDIEYESSCCV